MSNVHEMIMIMSNIYQQKLCMPFSPNLMGYVKDAYVWHVSMKMIMSNKHLLCPTCQRCLCPICINKNFVYHCHLPNGLCPRWLCPTCINKNFVYHCHLIKWVMPKMLMSNIYKKNFVYSVVTFWIMSTCPTCINKICLTLSSTWICMSKILCPTCIDKIFLLKLSSMLCQSYHVEHVIPKSLC